MEVVCEGMECVNVRTGSDGGQRSGEWISVGVVTGRGLGGGYQGPSMGAALNVTPLHDRGYVGVDK